MAEHIVAILILFAALLWWAALITLLARAGRWIWSDDGDYLFPAVRRSCVILERISLVTIGCFLLWMVVWLTEWINR